MKSIEINVGGKTKTFYRYPKFFTFGLGFGAIVYFVIGILYFIDREWELAFYDALVANMCLVLCHFYVKNNQLFDYVNDLYAQFDRLNKKFEKASLTFQVAAGLVQSPNKHDIGKVLVPYGQKVDIVTVPVISLEWGQLHRPNHNNSRIKVDSVMECTAIAEKVELYEEIAATLNFEVTSMAVKLASELMARGVIKIVPFKDQGDNPYIMKYGVFLKFMDFDKLKP